MHRLRDTGARSVDHRGGEDEEHHDDGRAQAHVHAAPTSDAGTDERAHPRREAQGEPEREEHAEDEGRARGEPRPPGLLAELYNGPDVGDLQRGGHAGHRVSPAMAGQPGEAGDRESAGNSTQLSGRPGNREGGAGRRQRHDGVAGRPDTGSPSESPQEEQMSPHDYNCNDGGRRDPGKCKATVTFAAKARQLDGNGRDFSHF
jgi:hypothetical protein